MQNKYNLSTKTTEILLLNNKKKKNNRDTTTEGCVTPSTCNLSIVPLFIKSTYNSKYRFFTLFKTGAAMMMHMPLTEVSQLFKSFLTACGQTVYTFCTHLNLIHSSSLGWTQSFDTDTATEWKQKKTPSTVSWKAHRPIIALIGLKKLSQLLGDILSWWTFCLEDISYLDISSWDISSF